ncbi:hypothetical protein QJS10_CPA09g01943 [Acorus calamus]|uniref:C2 domain-containing protein n=1 Tax=Acorus calamus TaxID=4465 RepID=A0AAV9EA82_ACOCL|nr:hypothetical protein QJS10_CPA09g01943 [Acorus calamus]
MSDRDKLVVEVIGAHNLMPKDGEGSSSAYVEVEFENKKLRTGSKQKDLNPVWNDRLVFDLPDPAGLPYRSIDVSVFNDRKSAAGGGGRNFLGRVRISGSTVASGKDDVCAVQMYSLEKRSLFSHVRGEITLKIYLSTEEGRVVVDGESKPQKQQKQKPIQNQQQQSQNSKKQQKPQEQQQKQVQRTVQQDPIPSDVKPVVITAASSGGPPPEMYPHGGFGFVGGGGADFALKETKPLIGGSAPIRDKMSSTYDLVEQMQYLYVRVVKARDLPMGDSVQAEVKLGNYRGITKRGVEWDQVFAFSKDTIQSSTVEVFVRERDKDDFIGRVAFDLGEVPRRVPPDSTLAPQWYRMEDKKGEKAKGEVMASVWFGTQADEAFSEAWHSKAAGVQPDGLGSIKSKVYLSPKLWYLRITVFEAQDIVVPAAGGGRYPELFVKAQLGGQALRTRGLSAPLWNEDLMFVVSEPFDDYLSVTIEDRVAPGRDDVLGRVALPIAAIERRMDDKPVVSRWFGLGEPKAARFGTGRVHLRLCLDGGYHVLDESTAYSSDVRPTEKKLWRPHVGVLEMGILGATNLMPTKPFKDGKGGGTADPYCVAKYGNKWVRTRTVVNSASPRWNEQYTWEVADPCTVITIGVFDNCRVDGGGGGERDARIGKVRIRLSTLESDKVYTHAYPLLVLQPSGVKKMGELHLAVRFTCTSVASVLQLYGRPLLPKIHYVEPLTVRQVEMLRYQATNAVAARLGRAEPPLGREVVEYMLDHGAHAWSMRRSKANFFRLVSVLSGILAFGRWVESVRSWHRPVRSVVTVSAFLLFDLCPELILPSVFLATAMVGLWRYRGRPRYPPHMDTRLSYAESVYVDELDEEFDTFPTSRGPEVVRMRYDRLRSVAGRIQTVVGDLATQGERMQALLSWRDPRATFLFVVFCFVLAAGFYTVPMRAVVGVWGVYAMRPPRFQNRMPSPMLSFFRRLPTRADSLL